MRKQLIKNKFVIKPIGNIALLLYVYLFVASKGIGTTSLYNVFVFLIVVMNSLTFFWFVAFVFNKEWRNKETVSVFTPFISATLITISILLIMLYASIQNT